MWQNVKYYAIAYGIVVLGALVSTGFDLLERAFPEFGPLNQLAANLSGITFGSVIMVVGLIRDKRFSDAQEEANKQRKRAENAEAAIAQANLKAEAAIAEANQRTEQAEQAIQQAEQANQQAEQERLRAQKAEAELARVRAEREAEILARIRRLEEFTGMTPQPPAD